MKKYIFICFLILICYSCNSDDDNSNLTGENIPMDIAIDSNGNVYVAGIVNYGKIGNAQGLIKKFNSNGQENFDNWNLEIKLNPDLETEEIAIAIDQSNNVYIVTSQLSGYNPPVEGDPSDWGFSRTMELRLTKLNPDGNQDSTIVNKLLVSKTKNWETIPVDDLEIYILNSGAIIVNARVFPDLVSFKFTPDGTEDSEWKSSYGNGYVVTTDISSKIAYMLNEKSGELYQYDSESSSIYSKVCEFESWQFDTVCAIEVHNNDSIIVMVNNLYSPEVQVYNFEGILTHPDLLAVGDIRYFKDSNIDHLGNTYISYASLCKIDSDKNVYYISPQASNSVSPGSAVCITSNNDLFWVYSDWICSALDTLNSAWHIRKFDANGVEDPNWDILIDNDYYKNLN